MGSLPRPIFMRISLPIHMLMSRLPQSPTFTRSPSLLPPPSSPPPPLLLTLLLPQWLPTTMLLPQLLTTTTSDTLPLPTPTLLPRLPKRCHTTFDDEDIQRRYLRQAVINCDKKDFIDIFSLFDHIGL